MAKRKKRGRPPKTDNAVMALTEKEKGPSRKELAATIDALVETIRKDNIVIEFLTQRVFSSTG
jgi:hypothetical protein